MNYPCYICKDDGECLNNKNHPHHIEEYSSIYDCCHYLDKDWMVKYVQRLEKKDKIPYVSDFCKWSKNCLK